MKKLFLLLIFFNFILNSQTLNFNPLAINKYPGNHIDTPVDLIRDSQGNVYFLDNTDLVNPGGPSGVATGSVTCLVKCNANGDTLWSRYFNEANTLQQSGTVLVVDNNDNVIVGGSISLTNTSNFSFTNFIVKYSAAGIELAADTFSNGKISNTLKAIAVDALDNIYVAAESQNSIYDKDILVYKLNSNLQRQWVNVYANTVNKDDTPVSILCNSQNEIYLAGTTFVTSSNQNILIIKYNTVGSVLWTLNYDHLGLGKGESLYGVALNDSCIYLCGTYNQTGSNQKNFMLKVSQSMAFTKAVQFEAVAYDGFLTGNFIIKDNTLALSTHYYNDSVAVTVLDTDFNVKYNKCFKGNTLTFGQSGVQNRCGGLSFNANKKLCVSLLLSDTLRVGANRYAKWYTRIVQMDSLGNVLYSKVLNKYPHIRESKVIWINNKNYILGQCAWSTAAATDIYLSVLDDTNGNLLNHTQFNCKERQGSNDITLKQLQLPNGDFVLGNTHSHAANSYATLDIINSAGQLQNSLLLRDSLNVNDSLMFIGKDGSNNIYSVISRRYYDSTTLSVHQTTIRIYKHNSNFQPVWIKDIRYKTELYALPKIALSDSGNVFMSGLFSSSNTNHMLLKVNNSGTIQWTAPINTNTTTVMNNIGLLCNKENVVYLYGSYRIPTPYYQNFSIFKYSANTGSLVLTSNYVDSLTSPLDFINDAQIFNNKIIATGRYGTNSYQFTASIDTANLNIDWIRFLRYSNLPSGGKSLFTDQGNIFVIGYTYTNVKYLNYIVFTKYDSSGNLQWSKGYKNSYSNWVTTDRYACASANGNTAVLATAEIVGYSTNKDFKILNYNYSTGNLINSIAWAYTATVTGCSAPSFHDVPLNINRNGPNDYMLSGYVNTFEYLCINPHEYYDTFYGILNPSIVTETKEELVSQNDFKIFPNPGNTELNIQLDNDISEYQISVYNVLGENVFTTTSGTNTLKLNTAGFINGIYFIKVRVGNREFAGKWVKSN